MFRIVFQSTPEKKGCALTSSLEFRPSRLSVPVSMLLQIQVTCVRGRSRSKSSAFLDTGDIPSDKIFSFSGQAWPVFWEV